MMRITDAQIKKRGGMYVGQKAKAYYTDARSDQRRSLCCTAEAVYCTRTSPAADGENLAMDW
jgi:hypothetical protein